MRETLRKLNTYADDNLGKISENLLRRIVTGIGSEGLPNSSGLQGQARANAPKQEDIQRDIRSLKVAYLTQGSKKSLVRMSEQNKKLILAQRIKAIGYTARTLIFDWKEATNSRIGEVKGNLSRDHNINIETIGKLPKATFRSISKGLIKLNKKYGIVDKEIAQAEADAIPYIQQIIKSEIRKMFK